MDEKRRRNSRKKATRALRKVEVALQNYNLRQAKDEFLEHFTKCELLYKSVLTDYKTEKKQDISEEKLVLDMSVIPAVMRYAGITMNKDTLLDPLFSSTDPYKRRNAKSAKQLRNGLVHRLSVEDMEEVLMRRECLITLMNNFIIAVKP